MKAKSILSGVLAAAMLISSAAFSAAAYEWEDAGSRYNGEQTHFTDVSTYKTESVQPIDLNAKTVTVNYDSNQKISVYVSTDDGGSWVANGGTVPAGSELWIDMDIEDYIDHKVLVNGQEIELIETGDEYLYNTNYIANTDVNIQVVSQKWSSARMSEYVTLNADRNAEVWFLNKYENTIAGYYSQRSIQNGDHIRKGDKLCIRVCYRPYEGMPEIYINGVYTKSSLNSDGMWQIWGYEVPNNINTLDIKIGGEKVSVNYNDSRVEAYFEGEGNTYVNNGDKLAKGTLMSIGMDIRDYMNNKVLVNGQELVLEEGSSEYWYYANYTANSDVTIDVVPEKWSDEKMSNYAVLDLGEEMWAFFCNSNSGKVSNYYRELQNGDYVAKGDYLYFLVLNKADVNTKPNVYINGVLADCQKDGDFWGISGYKVPNDVNKVAVRIVDSSKTAQVSEFVDRLYNIILDRPAESAGLADWTNALIYGENTSADIVYGLANSDEFKNKGLSNDEVIERMYLAMLGRGSDASGKADWLSAMANGCTVNGIINGFSGSQEFANVCAGYGISAGSISSCEARDINVNLTAFVSRMYTKALDRAYDVSGLNDWTGDYLAGKATADKIAYGFILSDEFVNRNLSDEAYVDTLYRTFFDREPDEGGKAGWLDAMANGASRQDVLDGFLGAEEFANLKASFGV